MSDYYSKQAYGGAFVGRTLIQAHGNIGGHKNVFVKLATSGKKALCYPTSGGVLVNPFPGRAKIYAGDICEYTPNQDTSHGASVKVLKYYELAKDATTTDTTYKFVRDGYHHIPFVGDNIMVGQKDFTIKAVGATITKVEKGVEGSVDVWNVTVSVTLGTQQKKGDVFVEAEKAGSSVLPMVTNPNAYSDKDADFLYDPRTGDTDYDGALYLFTPALANEDTIIDLVAIGNLPPAVLALNKSRVKSWFWFN